VRAGSLLLGYPSMNDGSNPLGVRESMSWRAVVEKINHLSPGESCGYDRVFVARAPTDVAVVNVGFGDGLFRPLAMGGGPVILGDSRTEYLACCMDMCFVNATGIACAVGDEVTLVGTSAGGETLSFTELQQYTGQSLSLPMVSINHRVKRVYTI
jgi:alanine racemase